LILFDRRRGGKFEPRGEVVRARTEYGKTRTEITEPERADRILLSLTIQRKTGGDQRRTKTSVKRWKEKSLGHA